MLQSQTSPQQGEGETQNKDIYMTLGLYQKFLVNFVVPLWIDKCRLFKISPSLFGSHSIHLVKKKREQKFFQLPWFDSRLWLHYNKAKDLTFCHLCILAFRRRKLCSLSLDKARRTQTVIIVHTCGSCKISIPSL